VDVMYRILELFILYHANVVKGLLLRHFHGSYIHTISIEEFICHYWHNFSC